MGPFSNLNSENYLIIMLIFLSVMVILFYLFKTNKKQTRLLKKLETRSTTKYLELADLLPQIVFEVDNHGNISFLNRIAYQLLGVNKFELQRELNIETFIHVDDLLRFKEDFLYIVEGGLNKGQEYTVVTKKGDKIPMIFYMSPIQTGTSRTGVRGIILDITEQKRLERKILSSVIETEERERQRFSEDLHDGLGPLLSTIKLYVNQMNKDDVNDDDKKNLLKAVYELLDEAIQNTRNIANNILPGNVSDNGLVAGLKVFIQKIEQTGALTILFSNSLKNRLELNYEKALYRIIIELINNTLKHADASTSEIYISEHEGRIEVVYKDDGKGCDLNKVVRGLGLENIKNRCRSINAHFKIVTNVGEGFSIFIIFEK